MSYIIRQGTYNGEMRREFCCHCGQANVCTSPLGAEAYLLCADCLHKIRRFGRDGRPIEEGNP